MLQFARPLRLVRLPARPCRLSLLQLTIRLNHQTRPTTDKSSTAAHQPSFIEQHLAGPISSAIATGKRAVLLSLLTLLGITLSAALVFEGAHIYVEDIALAPKREPEDVKQWQWDEETERWSSDSARGGTDSSLGIIGQHLVRMAWMAEHWSSGNDPVVLNTDNPDSQDLSTLKAVHADLMRSEMFLSSAVKVAENRAASSGSSTSFQTLLLMTRHAAVLERLGPEYRQGAKEQYERVWSALDPKSLEAARIALKLGDLTNRMGQPDVAVSWWARSISAATGSPSSEENVIPETLPSSPLAQRLLTSALLSLSSFYASSGNLLKAQTLEEKTLNLIRSLPAPHSLSSTSPPQALHHLTLLQRSAVISSNLAEVIYGQKRSTKTAKSSMQWLSSAVEASERVVNALTGAPLTNTNHTESSGQKKLLPAYADSPGMSKPAKILLRDARRTAATSNNLMGILSERIEPSDHWRALEYYRQAVAWAGKKGEGSDVAVASDDIPATEWNTIYGNYVRLSRIVEGKERK